MSYLLNSPLVLEGLCGRVSSSLLWIWNKIQNKIYKYNTKKKKKLENREKVDSFFRNNNSVGENDTSVWLREKPFTPSSGRRNACRKMTDDNTHDTYLLHVERVGVFGAELRQLEQRQAAGRFVRRGGQVRLLLHLRPPHRLAFFVVVSPDAWLRVTWLRFMLAVGGGRRPRVPRFRTVGRPRYRKIQIPLRFTGGRFAFSVPSFSVM